MSCMLFNRLITLAIFVYIIRQNEELWGTCIVDRRTNLQVTDGQIDIGQRETDYSQKCYKMVFPLLCAVGR